MTVKAILPQLFPFVKGNIKGALMKVLAYIYYIIKFAREYLKGDANARK